MRDENCAYCMQGELVAKFAYPICKMDTGFLYVFKEQSHPGRLILAHDKHISEMIELTDEERNAFFADVAKAARAIHKVLPAEEGELRRIRRYRLPPPRASGAQVRRRVRVGRYV